MMCYIMIFIWPLINFIQENFERIHSYKNVCVIFFTLIFLPIVCGFLLKKISKQPIDRWLLFVFSLVALFFSYSIIVESIGLRHIGILEIKATYIYLIIVATLGCVSWKISESANVQKISKIFIYVVFSLSVFNLVNKIMSCPSQESYVENFKKLKADGEDFSFKHKPNVYYILIDAYARQDTLREIAGFDNEPFLKELEQLNFSVSRGAHANYHFTIASLSATMDMKYHENDKTSVAKSEMYRSLSGLNNVRVVFKKNGYKIINIPAYFHETQSFELEDDCLGVSNKEILNSFLSVTPFRGLHLISSDYVDPKILLNALELYPNAPKFIFMHLAHVHDAIYDEEGKMSIPGNLVFHDKNDAKKYLYSIKAMNSLVIDTVKKIIARDADSVIIIQSDHGPTYYGNQPRRENMAIDVHEHFRILNKQDLRFSFGILSAVYVPNLNKNFEVTQKYFMGDFSLVNVFRQLFAYLAESVPKLLEDKTFFLIFNRDKDRYQLDKIDHLTN